MTSTWYWYDNHASDVIGRYESVSSSDVHGWLEPLLPGGEDLHVQVVHAVKSELARTPEDIVRRRLVRLGEQPALTEAVVQSMKTNSLKL